MDTVLTVSQLNQYVAELLSCDPILHELSVQGEISGFKRHSSGHLYFTLKDAAATVRCVMFRQNAFRLNFQPADGMLVTLYGYASLYARDGSFQVYGLAMEKQGGGALYEKFLQMKDALEKNGYFAAERKRPIPFLPRAVGVVTSGTGAAFHDILQIIDRRFPGMPVVLAPVKVQGDGAAEEIAEGIQFLNSRGGIDVIIVGRGGGSIEDLWAFNLMPVAQAVYDSRIPVISAVGHETDFTICDFVADLRAPTPSAAAELAVPERTVIEESLRTLRERLSNALHVGCAAKRSHLRVLLLTPTFSQIPQRIRQEQQRIDLLQFAMQTAMETRLRDARIRLERLHDRLCSAGPESILSRGYALLIDDDGRVAQSVTALTTGQNVKICMRDGSADATIINVEKEG